GEQGALVFSAVFLAVWAGAAIVTLNAQLLGGTISFFQSVCVLGYCVFPIAIAAAVTTLLRAFVHSMVAELILVITGFLWSTRASVVFIGGFISDERRTLAVFPCMFFYTFLSWMVLL
ncbi:hypothetical protein TeGR_g1164, partial [Tetraparma gracilis]